MEKEREVTHNAALKDGFIDNDLCGTGLDVAEFHPIYGIVDRNVHTPHHTLVVTKEEDGERAHTVDGDEQGSALIAVNHIGFWNLVHGCKLLLEHISGVLGGRLPIIYFWISWNERRLSTPPKICAKSIRLESGRREREDMDSDRVWGLPKGGCSCESKKTM